MKEKRRNSFDCYIEKKLFIFLLIITLIEGKNIRKTCFDNIIINIVTKK